MLKPSFRVIFRYAVLFILLASVLFLNNGTTTITQAVASNSYHKVVVKNEDTAALSDIQKAGASRLADYGSFSLWKVPDTSLNKAPSRTSMTVRDDYDQIKLRSGVVNTVTGAQPQIASSLTQVKSNDFQLWLVQFAGPVKPDWLAKVEQLGAQIVAYMPANAYVVWLDGSRLQQLGKLAASDPVIQWTGPYHPAYRLSPALESAIDNKTVAVTVQFFTTKTTNASVARLRALGGKVLAGPTELQNYTLVRLELPGNLLATIAAWPDVFNVEPWVAPQKNDEVQGQIIAGNITTSGGKVIPTGPGYLSWLDSKGFPTDPAKYPIVDVVDDGLDTGTTTPAHPDFYVSGNQSNASRVAYTQSCLADLSTNGVNGHGNLNAGIVAGFNDKKVFPYQDTLGFNRGLGISPFGRIASTKIFSEYSPYYDISTCQNSDLGVVEKSYQAGAGFTSNSWGSNVNGAYDASSLAYDLLTRDASTATPGNQPMLHVFSAGNKGSANTTIGSPGTAKNVLTVGATENVRDNGITDGCNISAADNADDIAAYSSRGTTTDGRAKPDIVAPGTHIQGPASQDPSYNGLSVCNKYYPNGQTLYAWSSGTSHSAPAASGSVSLAYNYYQRVLNPGNTPSPAMLKGLIINSARYLNGIGSGGNLPGTGQGWGDINLGTLFDTTTAVQTLDQTTVFNNTGETFVTTGQVADNTKPFRVTLVWTDPPGSTTGAALVNDLNLEVTVGGQTYLGNVFYGGISDKGGTADNLNNVENVFLPAGVTGNYTIKVVAVNLAGNAIPGSGNLTSQDFALIISNSENTPVGPLLSRGTINWSDISGNNNGSIDPGEVISLTIPLSNTGTLPASTVTSTLSLVQPVSATVTQGTSNYGDIAVGNSLNNATPFSITVDPLAPCGSPLNYNQAVYFNSGQVVTFTGILTVGVIAPVASSVFSATDVPQAIPDYNYTGISSSIILPDLGKGFKLRLRLNITHTWDADLAAYLTSPSGTMIMLFSTVGGSGDNFTGTIFDDNASTPISIGAAPFTGSFRPRQPLSTFNGQSSAGTWKLTVVDTGPADVGVLESWSLEVQPQDYACYPPGLVVKQKLDNYDINVPNTLSYALQNSRSGYVITFDPVSLEGNTVTVTGQLPPVQDGVFINGGACGISPPIHIKGTANSPIDGLVFGNNVRLRNLLISDFPGRQLVVPSGTHGLKVSCVGVQNHSP